MELIIGIRLAWSCVCLYFFFFVKSLDLFPKCRKIPWSTLKSGLRNPIDWRSLKHPLTLDELAITTLSRLSVIATDGKTIYDPRLGPLEEKDLQPTGKFLICSVIGGETLLTSFSALSSFYRFESASMLNNSGSSPNLGSTGRYNYVIHVRPLSRKSW